MKMLSQQTMFFTFCFILSHCLAVTAEEKQPGPQPLDVLTQTIDYDGKISFETQGMFSETVDKMMKFIHEAEGDRSDAATFTNKVKKVHPTNACFA